MREQSAKAKLSESVTSLTSREAGKGIALHLPEQVESEEWKLENMWSLELRERRWK